MSKECYCVSIYVISSKSKMISEFFFLFIFCVQKFTYHESRTLPYLYYISYLLPFYKLTILDLLYNLNIYRIGRGGLVKLRPTNAQMQDVSVAKPLHEKSME